MGDCLLEEITWEMGETEDKGVRGVGVGRWGEGDDVGVRQEPVDRELALAHGLFEKGLHSFAFIHSMTGLLFSSFLRRASCLISLSGQILTRKVEYFWKSP